MKTTTSQETSEIKCMGGFFGNSIICPIFINEILTGEVFCDLLQYARNPITGQEVVFQQDVPLRIIICGYEST